MRVTFLVTADVPDQATITEAKDFIRDTLQWAGGCRHPDDPMFESLDNITVKRKTDE